MLIWQLFLIKANWRSQQQQQEEMRQMMIFEILTYKLKSGMQKILNKLSNSYIVHLMESYGPSFDIMHGSSSPLPSMGSWLWWMKLQHNCGDQCVCVCVQVEDTLNHNSFNVHFLHQQMPFEQARYIASWTTIATLPVSIQFMHSLAHPRLSHINILTGR